MILVSPFIARSLVIHIRRCDPAFGARLSAPFTLRPRADGGSHNPGTALIPWFFQGLEVLVRVSRVGSHPHDGPHTSTVYLSNTTPQNYV